MSALTPSQRRLLIVENDPDIQDILNAFLTEEGFTVHFATSLRQALALLDEWAFQLILADLFVGRLRGLLPDEQLLLRHARLTPVGLMTTQNISPEQAKRQGFAFLLKKPFDLEDLLATIVGALQQPISPEQERQTQVVRRFIQAVSIRDYETLLALCTEEVRYYPPARSLVAVTRKVAGKAAFRAYMAEAHRHIVGSEFEEGLICGLPKGLALRYRGCWLLFNGARRHISGVLLFHFEGERISQLGLSLGPKRLPAVSGRSDVGRLQADSFSLSR